MVFSMSAPQGNNKVLQMKQLEQWALGGLFSFMCRWHENTGSRGLLERAKVGPRLWLEEERGG